jgi:hypothetical protein
MGRDPGEVVSQSCLRQPDGRRGPLGGNPGGLRKQPSPSGPNNEIRLVG